MPVINRLVYVDKWFRKDAIEMTKQYRNFLYLKRKYGNEYALPPSYEIDEVWHAHVLHTEDYMEFCNKAFGQYLHHHPHLSRESSGVDNLNDLFEKTLELYKKEFNGEIYAVNFMLPKKVLKFIFGKSPTSMKKTRRQNETTQHNI